MAAFNYRKGLVNVVFDDLNGRNLGRFDGIG